MTDRRLVRHLALAVVLKLALLSALWWVFVRDARVGIDAEAAAAHVTAPAQRTAATAGAPR